MVRSYRCCDVPISAYTLRTAAEVVIESALAASGGDVHLCNAYTLSLAERDHEYRHMLQRSWLNLADGMSVVWASRRYASAEAVLPERVYGPDLMLEVLSQGVQDGVRHYFYGGSSQAVLGELQTRLRERFPGVRIAGGEVPPFKEYEEGDMATVARRVTASRAHIVWIGLGTPKQDWATAALAAGCDAVCVAVGAAYDFLAGVKPQAPAWVQRSGLEWLYRLVHEPRRLWRRYVFGNTRFLLAVVRESRRA